MSTSTVSSKLSDEQQAEFEALARPLIKFLNDNMHPHSHILIHQDHVEITEGVYGFNTTQYITY